MADIRKIHYNVEGKKKGIPIILIIYELIKEYKHLSISSLSNMGVNVRCVWNETRSDSLVNVKFSLCLTCISYGKFQGDNNTQISRRF